MTNATRRRRFLGAAVVAAIGFAVGVGYRFFVDNADERELAKYLRSGLHGVGIAMAVWLVQTTLGPSARSSLGRALRRLPLLSELIARSLVMTLVIIVVGVALQFALYAEPYRLHWFKLDWFTGTLPWIIALGLVISFMIGAFTEAGRMIGASMLVNIALGTYHRPKREQLIVMFLDLANSTQLAEAMGELKVHDLITRFFFDIEAPITDYGGAVHAYVGDEVIVTWPLDTDGARNTRCLECCASIDRTMADLAGTYQRAFAVVPQFRAALHCGPVIVSECGSAKRQLAFFGDTMNVTARLCEYCRHASQHLVVSADLLSRLTIPPDLVFGKGDTIALRGRQEPIEVHAIQQNPLRHTRKIAGLLGSRRSEK
jgi:adenylate cyclase